MKKIIFYLRLLLANPKRVIELARKKFLVPSNIFMQFIRRLYCVFVPNRLEHTEGNHDRLLLVYDTISNSVTFDFLHVLYYADWRRRQVGQMYFDVVIVSRSQQFLLEESYVAAVGEDSSYWRIDNMLYPLCKLFSSLGRVYIVEQEVGLPAKGPKRRFVEAPIYV